MSGSPIRKPYCKLLIINRPLFSPFCIPRDNPILQFCALFGDELFISLPSLGLSLLTCGHFLPAENAKPLPEASQDSLSLGESGPLIGWLISSMASSCAIHVGLSVPPVHCHPAFLSTSTAFSTSLTIHSARFRDRRESVVSWQRQPTTDDKKGGPKALHCTPLEPLGGIRAWPSPWSWP